MYVDDESLSDDDIDVTGGVSGVEDESPSYVLRFYPDACDNCHRRPTAPCSRRGRCTNSSHFHCRLSRVWLKSGAFRRKFCTMKYSEAKSVLMGTDAKRCRKGQLQLSLCSQCKTVLTVEPSHAVSESAVWPAMFWKWLVHPDLLRLHSDRMWSIVPRPWRKWWIRAVTDCVPQYVCVTVQNPPPVFADVTERRDAFMDDIASMSARRMQSALNKHLHAIVRCPFGCSEYLHTCTPLPLEGVVRKFFGSYAIPFSGDTQKVLAHDAAVDGMVPDFLDASASPLLLGNRDWRVHPSVAFVDGTPRVLCCREHAGGGSGKYLHPPRNPKGTLASVEADQLTPLVTRSRQVRQFKAHAYSNTYQMSEMQGQFAGVDTLHLSDTHDFTSRSSLLEETEGLSVGGRRDIRNLVTDWCSGPRKIVPTDVGTHMFENAEVHTPGGDMVESCCRAATYVTLSDAVKLYQTNRARQGHVIRETVDGETKERHYKPTWPSTLIHVHPCDKYGSDFPLVPKMVHDEVDCRLLWSVSAMLIGVSSLWEKTDGGVTNTDHWGGWLLSHLSGICFPTL